MPTSPSRPAQASSLATASSKSAQALPTPAPLSNPGRPFTPEETVLWPQYCGTQAEPKSFHFNFNDSEFRFSENIADLNHYLAGIFGETQIVPASSDQEANIKVTIKVTPSDTMEVQKLVYTQTPYTIELDNVFIDMPDAEGAYCMSIETIISIKPDLVLDNFDIDSRNTKAQLYGGINLNVTGLTSVTLSKGSFKSSLFTSRQTKIAVESGSISGDFALLDRLILSTETGPIDVDVQPGDMNPERPAPALFCAHSHSGSIKARYNTTYLPDRDYRTKIESGMGSIEGVLVHGSETEIKALSGSIKTEVVPYSASSNVSTLSTETMSGSTQFVLLPPYSNPGTPVSALKSKHDGKSGRITLKYPQEWVGSINGGTASGRLNVQGKDLVKVFEGAPSGSRAKKHIEATKGSGNSTLEFNNQSGSCQVRIGDV